MPSNQKTKIRNWVGPALLVLVLAALTAAFFLLRAQGRLPMFASQEAFRQWLVGFGAWAPLLFLLLQVAQVLVAFIPGEVTGLAGGMMFGFWWGTALTVVGIALGSAIAFRVARRLGRPAVEKLAGSASLDRYMELVRRHSVWLLFTMFLLPFFPKDALCYVAGLTGVPFPVFLLVCTFGRLPGQAMASLVGAGLLTVPAWGWVVIALAAAGLVFLSFKYADRVGEWVTGRLGKRL